MDGAAFNATIVLASVIVVVEKFRMPPEYTFAAFSAIVELVTVRMPPLVCPDAAAISRGICRDGRVRDGELSAGTVEPAAVAGASLASLPEIVVAAIVLTLPGVFVPQT